MSEFRLYNFLDRAHIRIQDLLKICSKIDWLDQNAQQNAKSLLGQQLQLAESIFESQARKQKVSRSTLIRNFIACSGRNDLEVFRLLFLSNQPYWRDVLGGELSKIKSLLPRHSRSGKAIKLILDGKKNISAQSLSWIVPNRKQAICNLLFRELQHDREMSRNECLVHFLMNSSALIRPSEPGEIVKLLFGLAPSFSKTLNCLDRSDLDELSIDTRRAILISEKSRSTFLEPNFLKEFVANPRTHDDSLESIRAKETVAAALKSVVSGKLNSGTIRKVLDDQECLNAFRSDLVSVLQKCTHLKSWTTSHKMASKIAKLPSSEEFFCLQFFSEIYSKRADLLAGCTTHNLNKIVGIVGANNVVDALCISNRASEVLTKIAVLDAVQKAIIDRLRRIDLSEIGKPKYLAGKDREFLSAMADKRVLKLIAIAEHAGLFAEKHCKGFVKKIDDLDSLENSEFLHDPLALEILWNSGFHGVQIVTKIMNRFKYNRAARIKWLEKLPRETSRAIGDYLSVNDLGVALKSPRRNTLVRLFLEPTWRSENKLWRTYLKALKRDIAPLPHLLKTYMGKHPPVLQEIFLHAPSSCVSLALNRLTLFQILPIAFKSKHVALAVEKKWSRRTLKSYIGWVQYVAENGLDGKSGGKWPPQVSAAYQCALAFGLHYSNYLVSLSKLVKRQADVDKRGSCFDHLYSTYNLPKKSGGNRLITAPDEKLKNLQRAILNYGFAPIDKSPSATGFRKGTSIVGNALPHVAKKIVVNVDIEGFFPNTSQSLIREACRQLVRGELSDDAQILVAEICGYKGALPTGAPTSPAIANIILAQADKALRTVCKKHRISFTRYADDLTFSGNNGVLSVLPFAQKVLADFGYKLDAGKTNIFRKGRRQIVTGLVVNAKPNLAKPIRKRIRAAVHNRVNGHPVFWYDKPMSDCELLGRIAFLAQTQPNEAEVLREKLGRVINK